MTAVDTVTPSRKGRQHATTRKRKQEILAAAIQVFAAKGYSNGALSQVAEIAGISAPTIIHHFSSKTGLLTAVLTQRDQAGIEAASQGRQMEGQEFLDHLVDTARANSEARGTTQLYAVLSADSVTDDHPAQQWFRDRYAGLRPMVADALYKVTDGEAEPAAVEQTAAAIVAVMDGLQVQWLLDPTAVDMEAVTQRTITALVAALRDGQRRDRGC